MTNLKWNLLVALLLGACGDGEPPGESSTPADGDQDAAEVAEEAAPVDAANAADELPVNPSTGELLPMPFAAIWAPALVDYETMLERRVIRVVVPYGGYQFYYDGGRPKGAVYDLVQRFEDYLNDRLDRRNIKIYVVVIPVSRNELLPALQNGHADFVAADLTITEQRALQFRFSRPLKTDVNEVVVTGPSAPEIETLEDLAGQEVLVRESSSYYEHLQNLAQSMRDAGLQPPVIQKADELLEAEDLLEIVNAGIAGMTILDEYKALFWADVFPEIVVHNELMINEGGSIAWATRKDTPELSKVIDGFLRKYGKGTLVGNDTFNRYLKNAERVRCSYSQQNAQKVEELAALFQTYGEQYDFDWLMLAAQGFQESGLQQDTRSPAGAVGIMQVKPSTAADRNVGINDISSAENNIHAGAKYLRFLADRYFDDAGINDLNQWLLSLAAYNAGPAKVARMRREARENGYDPNIWFDNVEIIAARRIGRETVTYVSNIFKYYVGYQIISERVDIRSKRHGETLRGCL
jgi:membrane-bound lytic murein transglycosylase MltF